MEELTLKIKKLHPEAVIPSSAFLTDAGYDCVAINDGDPKYDEHSGVLLYVEYKTGLACQLPEGYHIELFPRGSVSKTGLILANSIGLVDNAYRGEIVFRYKAPLAPDKQEKGFGAQYYHTSFFPKYNKGDRIGQIVIRKTYKMKVVEVEELDKTDRGIGAFGSTGR
jgi:dUTP pyrophosphatase